jgi:hypothetical protein
MLINDLKRDGFNLIAIAVRRRAGVSVGVSAIIRRRLGQRQPRAGATWVRIDSIACAL